MSSIPSCSAFSQRSIPGKMLQTPHPKMSILPLKSTQLNQNLSISPRSEPLLMSATTAVPSLTVHFQPNFGNPASSTMPTTVTQLPPTAHHPAKLSAVQSKCTTAYPMLPNPPPLHLGPVLEQVSQHNPLSCPPPLTQALPMPVQPERLPKYSVPSIFVQSDHTQVPEEEILLTEKNVQRSKILPPLQTEGLKVSRNIESPMNESMVLENDLKLVYTQGGSTSPAPPLSIDGQELRSSKYVPQLKSLTVDPYLGRTSIVQSSEVPASFHSPLLSSVVRCSSKLNTSACNSAHLEALSQAISGSRPHILTHLIEGFIFHEGLEPFPATAAALEMNLQATLPQDSGEEESSHVPISQDSPSNDLEGDNEQNEVNVPSGLCEHSGFTQGTHESKHFCTVRRLMRKQERPFTRFDAYASAPYDRPQHRDNHTNATRLNSITMERKEEERSASPRPATTLSHVQTERKNKQGREARRLCSPSEWSVEEVCSFIRALPGCGDVAVEFRSQEIDGQSLLLLTEEHLMHSMNIKLGPAIKIFAQIKALKQDKIESVHQVSGV